MVSACSSNTSSKLLQWIDCTRASSSKRPPAGTHLLHGYLHRARIHVAAGGARRRRSKGCWLGWVGGPLHTGKAGEALPASLLLALRSRARCHRCPPRCASVLLRARCPPLPASPLLPCVQRVSACARRALRCCRTAASGGCRAARAAPCSRCRAPVDEMLNEHHLVARLGSLGPRGGGLEVGVVLLGVSGPAVCQLRRCQCQDCDLIGCGWVRLPLAAPLRASQAALCFALLSTLGLALGCGLLSAPLFHLTAVAAACPAPALARGGWACGWRCAGCSFDQRAPSRADPSDTPTAVLLEPCSAITSSVRHCAVKGG